MRGGLAVDPIQVQNIISQTYDHDPDDLAAIETEAALAEERLWYFMSSLWHPKYPQFMLNDAQVTLDITANSPA